MSSVDALIEELKKILNKKLISLNKIYDITSKQKYSIINYNVDELNDSIDKKQEQIDAVNELDNKFDAKFLELKKDLGVDRIEQATENLEEFKVIQSFITEIQDAITRIIELEKQNSEISRELQTQIKERIQQTGRDKKILHGYNPSNISSPAFFDKKK
ncbi:MAG: flagellar export chaperone FlgN [Ignavibacteriales bacterium]